VLTMTSKSLSKPARATARSNVIPLQIPPFDETKLLEVVRRLDDDQKGRILDLAWRVASGEEVQNCDTGPRIFAFLWSVRPQRGCDTNDDDEFHRGRALIERLALSAPGEGEPRMRLTQAQSADVVHFLARIEPFEPRDWWNDPEGQPSHFCGFTMVLDSIEDSLRAGRRS
jgi:hypothetical protein